MKDYILKVLIAVVLYAGMLFLIDWRLDQVEQERCEINHWDVCSNLTDKQMLLSPMTKK